jgi:hypothetical protein
LFAAQQLRGPASTWWANFVAIQPAGHQITWEEFKLAFWEHYVPEGVLHMKQEEFIRLKQGGDAVMQYLNKFNHLSQYAIDQVNTDLKKKNCFMRGLNDRIQQKMATCLDLTYSRAVSTTLAVEAKNAGHGKSKGFEGERSNQGPEKRTRLVSRPFNQNHSSPRPPSYPLKQPVFIRPTTAPAPTNQPSASGTRFPALPSSSLVASPVESPDTLSRTAHTWSKINPISNKTLGTPTKEREIRLILQRGATPKGEPIMMGTFLVANYPTIILFDSGASHTFISKNFVENHCIPCTESREEFIIHSPGGQIFTKEVAFHIPVTLAGRELPTNMIVLKGQDIDVILGMNWLAQHKAIINTYLRTIKLSHGHEEIQLSILVAVPLKLSRQVYEAIIPEI